MGGVRVLRLDSHHLGDGDNSMKKLERIEKDYGGGSGHTIFKSALFRVVVWTLQKGTKTTLTYNNVYNHEDLDISFEGRPAIVSDAECMDQLTSSEILLLLTFIRKDAYKAGRLSKAADIKACLFDD